MTDPTVAAGLGDAVGVGVGGAGVADGVGSWVGVGVGLTNAAVFPPGGAPPQAIRMSPANKSAAWRLEPIADLNGRGFGIVMTLVAIVGICGTELIIS